MKIGHFHRFQLRIEVIQMEAHLMYICSMSNCQYAHLLCVEYWLISHARCRNGVCRHYNRSTASIDSDGVETKLTARKTASIENTTAV